MRNSQIFSTATDYSEVEKELVGFLLEQKIKRFGYERANQYGEGGVFSIYRNHDLKPENRLDLQFRYHSDTNKYYAKCSFSRSVGLYVITEIHHEDNLFSFILKFLNQESHAEKTD